MNKNKDLNYYLNLPWTFSFEWSNEDKCYVASVAELKGCLSDGETIEEATNMIKEALECHIESMLKSDCDIPEPFKPIDFKGVITYRTTPETHYKLAQRAGITNKSINYLIDEAVNEKLKQAS